MYCPNCGAENINGSTFCVKCGANLSAQQSAVNINTAPVQNANVEQVNGVNGSLNQNLGASSIVQNQVQSSYQQTPNSGLKNNALNYLMYVLNVLWKPIKTFKEEEEKLNDSKTSLVFALIVALGMTVINLIKVIFSTVRVASYSFIDGYSYSWQWENIKDIKWIEVIGKNFLIYIGIILAITVVFYIGSLIVKKQLSFIKCLSIASTAIIPVALGVLIIGPLVGLIWYPLNMIFIIISGVYSILILYELMNTELDLANDVKVYFNLVCFALLVIVAYYAFMLLFKSSVTDELTGILNLFG